MNLKLELLPRCAMQSFNPKDKKCEEPVSAITVEMGRGRNRKLKNKCGCFAKFKLNGKHLCLRHAQQEALNILLRECK